MNKNLSSLLLDSFSTVVQDRSFKTASQRLGISQPALSLRIQKLEAALGQSLLIRNSKNIQLTELGEALLHHQQVRHQLDQEFLSEFIDNQNELTGTLRIGSFTSFTRSLLIPQLSLFKKRHPGTRVNIVSEEIDQLPFLLKKNAVDYIFNSTPLDSPSHEQINVFQEKYVLIQSRDNTTVNDTFIDLNENEQITFQFMKKQNSRPKNLQRIFIDEIYCLIDGVAQGWGRAVVPSHLVSNRRDIKILDSYKPIFNSIYLSFIKRPFYSKLHKEFVKDFITQKKSIKRQAFDKRRPYEPSL